MCKRYPGKRPSDYLDLDSWTGFQLDLALAVRYDLQDKDFIRLQTHEIITAIGSLMKAMGAKNINFPVFKETVPSERDKIPDPDYIPTVDEIISVYGGKGTVLKK